MPILHRFAGISLIFAISTVALARDPVPVLQGHLDRPLRYLPDHGDFVIENGTANFNRPLYTAHTPMRVDAGDRPEFGFVFPTKGGVLRLGIVTPAGAKWLIAADHVATRYRPGSLVYEIRDALLGHGVMHITALPTQELGGLVLSAQVDGAQNVELVWAYGAGTNESSRNHWDLQDSADPGAFWVWNPADCAGADLKISDASFTYATKAGTMLCVGPSGSRISVGDAAKWNSIGDLLTSTGKDQPVAVGRAAITAGAVYLSIQRDGKPGASPADLFSASEKYRESVADRVVVDTPDDFINASAGAMCIAADDIWESPHFMHGANAWRTPLLGWRGPYALDVLGWHDRGETQFTYWAGRQNVSDDFPTEAHADAAKNLAENDWKALHSNGNIPQSHYDMNLPFIDELYWHFFWTGDVAYVKKMWPVITRHLAWEKRCFDRDGLYEGYAAIWASDALEYNGGGAAHSSAYNYLHNLLAAKMAKVIGEDPTPYQKEADRIHAAMIHQLWLPDRGWFGEYKDLLGLQRVHPDAALWSVYHVIDSQVPDTLQAYQMLRYVDTQIAHILVQGPGVAEKDLFVLPESDWQPYEWSLNNVVLAENAHTALAYWQSGQNEQAWKLWKGAMLDAMFMGICPGDLPNLSYYDPNRGESYRDFGDATGSMSRAFIQGLFGIVPDAIDGVLTLRPGFPKAWDYASIKTPDVEYSYRRDGQVDRFVVAPKFSKPMELHLIWPARMDHVVSVEVNGKPATWKNTDDAVGTPTIEIDAPAESRIEVNITWSGDAPAPVQNEKEATGTANGSVRFNVAPAELVDISDPQQCMAIISKDSQSVAWTPTSTGTPGHRTAFARVKQGDLSWWMPLEFANLSAPAAPAPRPVDGTKWEAIDLGGVYNDRVTQIFKNDYLSPRTPFVSLQIPKQGVGEWTGFWATANIDDKGLPKMLKLEPGIPLQTGGAGEKNIAFTSRWDNYPHEVSVPLSGKSGYAILLMAGSTNPMETQIDNGELVATYADGSTQRLALKNPTNWCPIEKDYFTDDYAFSQHPSVRERLRLSDGKFYTPAPHGGKVDGGAATVIDFPLDSSKELKSLTVRTLSNQVVIGLMGVTLAR